MVYWRGKGTLTINSDNLSICVRVMVSRGLVKEAMNAGEESATGNALQALDHAETGHTIESLIRGIDKMTD